LCVWRSTAAFWGSRSGSRRTTRTLNAITN
jgi:hypothetical protein